ncbi:hypothetical protein [Blastococcus sp. CT_GayMR16]|uniref:hypothetical protein n=1 Tax=Blastococcus sp. CT_GayMR16 TaxID=2559607 RepID=UPI0010738254|nr:hypothetical protein [Blastococcus sp. CT_GayMR16]TFV91393.1 hypothetical protein E4P38_02055 [Blastococcus sp. CT_GayMR16]
MTGLTTGAMTVTGEGRGPVHLTAAGARKLTEEIRHHLGTAIVKLTQAREGGADEVLGYPSWHAYVEAEFGDLRELRLPVVERRALVSSMRGDDLSVRQIAGKLGVSVGTVHADLPETRERTADVVQLRPDPAPSPIADLPKTDQVVILVGMQGDRGLTCRELELETGWGHGTASGALSRVARQQRVRHDGRFRREYGVYVIGPDA